MKRWLPLILLGATFPALTLIENIEVIACGPPAEPADLIVHHGKVVTLDEKDRVVQALAIRGEKIIAVGADRDVLKRKGPKTRVIDAGGRTVLPGLYVGLCAAVMLDLLIVKPVFTWPGLLLVLAGIPVYFLWRWLR